MHSCRTSFLVRERTERYKGAMGSSALDDGLRERRSRWTAFAFFLLLILALDALSCAIGRRHLEPISAPASALFAQARAEERGRREDWRERAQALARRALEAEPGWVAPARFLDELERSELRGQEVLKRRLEILQAAPELPAHHYLVGRLEGERGRPRFEEALRIDRRFAWGHHGLAWSAFEAGNAAAARRHGERALACARDPFERALFVTTLVRYELALKRPARACEQLKKELERSGFDAGDRLNLEVWLARSELETEEREELERGFWRAVRLLREDLTGEEVWDLGLSLLANIDRVPLREPLAEVETALAGREGIERDVLRARLFFDRGEFALGLALEKRRGADPNRHADPSSIRAARLAQGEGGSVVEDWLAALPFQVLDANGLPRRAELAELVESARTAPADTEETALAGAMLEAGWFQEARGLASALAAEDPAAALELEREAAEASAVLAGIRRLLERVDEGEEFFGPLDGRGDESGDSDPASTIESGKRIENLEGLLSAMEPLFDRHAGTRFELARSPLLEFGPFARVVHPGPTFSKADERAGLGSRGDPVGGLAAAFLELGRFGLFGETLGGGGPDGTVLRLVAFEEREGEHLGRSFSGTVAWCEGTEVPSRPARRGGRISGAALHEGFWIDIDTVRGELERWRLLEEGFLAGDGERARRALQSLGPELAEEAASSERTAVLSPLGEGDRIRLAVLLERESGPAGRITLEELLEATARHEEGHLLDRERFIPLWKDPLGAFGMLLKAGFSAQGLMRLLEFRAQLVALATADDPRFMLAECADALEGGNSVTVHAAAYTELIGRFLRVLERERETIPSIDERHPLLFQLHRLTPAEVRAVAVELAREEGIARE